MDNLHLSNLLGGHKLNLFFPQKQTVIENKRLNEVFAFGFFK